MDYVTTTSDQFSAMDADTWAGLITEYIPDPDNEDDMPIDSYPTDGSLQTSGSLTTNEVEVFSYSPSSKGSRNYTVLPGVGNTVAAYVNLYGYKTPNAVKELLGNIKVDVASTAQTIVLPAGYCKYTAAGKIVAAGVATIQSQITSA